jgi:hypothetical protein
MSRRLVHRRRALALGLALGASAVGATVLRRSTVARTLDAPPPALRDALQSVLSDPVATRRLGAAYLREEPQEASIGLLLHRLPVSGATADQTAARFAADPAAVLAKVGAASTAEFSNGDTVVVNGWELGRSEARLAALYATVG